MRLAVYLPFATGLLLVAATRWLTPRATPGRAVWALTAAATIIGATQLWALVLLAGSLVDDIPGTAVSEAVPVPDALSVMAGAVLLWSAEQLVRTLSRQVVLRRRLLAAVGGYEPELLVVADERPRAFAVAGRPGWIVATDAMLRGLTTGQRQVLSAHERAHLVCRHSAALTVTALAAAVSPMLVPVRAAVPVLCERQADEVAAAARW